MNNPIFSDPLLLSQFHYHLPEDSIAQFPLAERDEAKLLVYKKGNISHQQFFQLSDWLQKGDLLVLNNTKVIQARLFFQRRTGANIEILLMEPVEPVETSLMMQQRGSCIWKCVIGNKKKWKEGEILDPFLVPTHSNATTSLALQLKAEWHDKDSHEVKFSWQEDLAFGELLSFIGNIPLPPYMNREVQQEDNQRYQTIYSEKQGAVASPTAGLHYTQRVFDQLADKDIELLYTTLHVGGGTFLPVKREQVLEHDMHAEEMLVQTSALEQLLSSQGRIVAAGTTAMRWLESVYWLGVKASYGSLAPNSSFFISKLYPYESIHHQDIEMKTSIESLLTWMQQQELTEWVGKTAIMIVPGYQFRVCRGLQTNFHLPETTLMLLVAAFIGEDWKKIYQEALNRSYRFLSYGDSSLLLP